MKIYKDITELIGHTPLVEFSHIEANNQAKAKIIGKVEYFNPAGSIKDRAAMEMILDYEANGELYDGVTIIEPTSGNTGIALAAIGAARGYKVIIVMPENMSPERIKIMRAYGAEVILTDKDFGMQGAIDKAEELKRMLPRSIICGQFINFANPTAHYKTTGPEIWEDTDGKVDILVASIGTGGTISGTGSYLKSMNPDILVIGVEPAESNILSGGKKGPHKIQGIGAGFIPDVLDTFIYDEIIAVKSDDAFKTTRELAKLEGIMAGISSGAALNAAIELSKREENKGKNIVVILPDTGMRYLSGDLF